MSEDIGMPEVAASIADIVDLQGSVFIVRADILPPIRCPSRFRASSIWTDTMHTASDLTIGAGIFRSPAQ